MKIESNIEKNVALFLMSDPQVESLEDQPPSVSFIDRDGTKRFHTFDFRVRLFDGRRIFVVVKDRDHAAKNDVAGFVAHIAAQIPKSVADGVVLYTEAMLSPAMQYNARLIQAARRSPVNAADAKVAGIITSVTGRVRVGEIVRVSGLEGVAFQAVVRLVARRVLTLTADERIDYGTFVVVAPRHAGEATR